MICGKNNDIHGVGSEVGVSPQCPFNMPLVCHQPNNAATLMQTCGILRGSFDD